MLAVHLAIYGLFWFLSGTGFGWPPAILASLLIWVSSVDFRVYEIPDTASLLLILSGVALNWQDGALPFVFAAALWGIGFWFVASVAYRVLGEDGLGLGDVKLMAGIAAWLGPVLPIYVVLGASVAAILTILVTQSRKGQEFSRKAVAFGPFLCLSAWVIWMTGA